MILVCHMISENHMIKESCDFMAVTPSWNVTTLLSLMAISIVVMNNNLVVEEGNFTRSRLNPLLLLSVKHLTCYAPMHDNLEQREH